MTLTPMGEVNIHEGLTPEGNELKETAQANAAWLKGNLTPELLDRAKLAGLLSEDEGMLLAECINFENYIPKSETERAHVDQLIESLKEFAETT